MTENKESKATADSVSVPIQIMLTSLPLAIICMTLFAGNSFMQLFPTDMYYVAFVLPVIVSIIYIPVYCRVGKTMHGIAIVIAGSLSAVSTFVLYGLFLFLLPIIFTLAVVGIAYYSRKWNKKMQEYKEMWDDK